jgi:succinate-semialdehyde dehydrogenase/glutarate-semialdehyde dehydrogenase
MSAPATSAGIAASSATPPRVSHDDLRLLIDGEWLDGAGRTTRQVINPATEVVLGSLPLATPADLDRALDAAQRAWPSWRALGARAARPDPAARRDLLRSRTEEIARLATLEEGKTLTESRIEVGMAANVFEWYAEEGRRAYGRVLPQQTPGVRMTVVREPVGPVAAFAPWNFPLGNPARKLGAALGAGCTCILKPAEEAPASALAIAAALVEAGVPPGVIAIVFGDPAAVSAHLIASPVIRKISFTGSVPVGKQLLKLAAEGAKRTTMELGGHAPVIVFDDVDLEHVLDLAVAAKFRNAGQVCVSPTRFYVQEALYERFLAGFASRAKALRVDDGLVDGARMGPLAHARRLAAVETFIEDAHGSGSRVVAGGRRIARKGWFHEPTVLGDVPDSARMMNEEPFGPIALINRFDDFDTVIRAANRLPYGLAAFAFTRDARRVNLLGEQIEAGMIGINSFTISVPESPFGGMKESGHGSEEGIEGLDACLATKFITES